MVYMIRSTSNIIINTRTKKKKIAAKIQYATLLTDKAEMYADLH